MSEQYYQNNMEDNAAEFMNSGKAADAYSDEGLMGKLKRVARKLGKPVLNQILTLFYCLKDPKTPEGIKLMIIAALGYFIFPIDAIPDLIPGLGYSDDIAIIAVVLHRISAHVTEEHKEKARETTAGWLGA
jgi:uncharacterized membrane protein YkvA (DUF1232 family)